MGCRCIVRYLDRIVRLPEPSLTDPESSHAARLLQLLLQALLLWLMSVLLVGIPLFAVRKAVSVALCLVGLAEVLLCAYLLRCGRVRLAAWIYLTVGWLGTLVCAVLSAGLRSPYIALHVVVPVIAGLLLGRRVGVLTLSGTGLVMLSFVMLEHAGYALPAYFPMPGAMVFAGVGLAVILTYLTVNHAEMRSRLTALRLSEERLHLALQGSSVAVFDWDVPNDRCLLSSRFYSLLGVEQSQEGASAPPPGCPPLDAELSACKREMLLQVAAGRDHIEHEIRLPAVGGERIWFHVRASVTQHDGQGNPLRIVGTLLDVTDQKRAQQELARARDLAKEAVQAKTAFLANMSHEIRTPVSSVIGLAKILSEQPLPPEPAEIVKLILSSGQGLLEIINDILDLSRIEAGQIPIRREETELSYFCQHVVRLLDHAANAKGLRLVFESISPAPESVRVDPKLLRQVLLNLLTNAIKFTESGEIRLRLEWMPEYVPAGAVKFSVTDTGPGIAYDQQTMIFEPFGQVDSTSSRSHTGTGLGLTICRKLVHALGGQIGVQSKPGSGSTFWFTVPVEVAPAQPRPVAEQSVQVLTAADLRVLVAEDNKVNRLVAVRCLSTLGIRADTAENGEQAITAASSTPYDLILMDVQMPVIDGLQATRAIRVCGRGNPLIVALTAHVLPEHRAECLAAGMNGFLSKPLEAAALRKILAGLGQSKASAQTA